MDLAQSNYSYFKLLCTFFKRKLDRAEACPYICALFEVAEFNFAQFFNNSLVSKPLDA
jgi:hypothetical protein|tara:strand:- start:14124 stop:14297 length:174 start_codon:yes stop_codon:yes gene_type:complete